jgi:hypothetical protein
VSLRRRWLEELPEQLHHEVNRAAADAGDQPKNQKDDKDNTNGVRHAVPLRKRPVYLSCALNTNYTLLAVFKINGKQLFYCQ